jgi:hypothetical protein
LHSNPQEMPAVHRFYGPAMAISGTTMAIGFSTFLANVFLTMTSSSNKEINGAPD